MISIEKIKQYQIYWSDSIRDRYFKNKYNSFRDSWIKRCCIRIDDLFKKYTNAKIVKSLVEIEIGYKHWQYITREKWLKGYTDNRDRAIWNTYFDTSTGQYIDSYSKVKEIEATGHQYMTMTEHSKLMKKHREEQTNQTKTRITNELQKCFQELKQGKSFVKELRDKGYGK